MCMFAAGKRKNVAYDTLVEAADYARFACAAYAVVEYQDTRCCAHTLVSLPLQGDSILVLHKGRQQP